MDRNAREVAQVNDARDALDRMIEAIEARDGEGILDALSDDVTIETELLDEPLQGKDTMRSLLAHAFDAYESIDVERRMTVAEGPELAALVRIRARFGDDLEILGETLPTAGKALDVAGAVFARVDGRGKIAWLMRVRDTFGILRQLGLTTDQMDRLIRKFEEHEVRRPPRAA
jgi:predicted ester cyclase